MLASARPAFEHRVGLGCGAGRRTDRLGPTRNGTYASCRPLRQTAATGRTRRYWRTEPAYRLQGKHRRAGRDLRRGLSQFTAHSSFGKAQELIAPFSKVCIYDRAGLGWSDPAPGARTQQDMVEDLHRLIAAKGLEGPLVLVGHSMGGLLVRLYAKRYPSQVAAIVLLDATPESYNFAPGAAEGRMSAIAQIDAALAGARDGVPVVALPPETAADVMLAFTPEILRSVKQEYEAIDLLSEDLRRPGGYGTLGDKPLAVIRRGLGSSPPSEQDERWRKAQEALTFLSAHSVMIVAEKAGHVIAYDQPEIVADTVRKMLGEIGER